MPNFQFSSITEQVAAHLGEELRRGRWRETMPGRNQLVRELGVSGKTVELALQLLNFSLELTDAGSEAGRALFQIGATDSSTLIDSPAASMLGPNRGLLYSDERGTVEKFRPWALPSEAYLVAAGRALG